VLRGVVIHGNDSRISRKIATRVGGWGLRVRGDLWQAALLDRMSVSELLELMAA
jgi:hypothetical protein